MSKTLKIILVLSLAANAAWAIGALGGFFSSAKSSPKNAARNQAATSAKHASAALSPEAARELKTLLTESDAATLRDRLNALGLPKETVRRLVSDCIWIRYGEKMKEIGKAQMDAIDQIPYWQRANRNSISPEERERLRAQQNELQKLGRAASDEVTKVLGPDENAFVYSQQGRSFLPPEKIAQLQVIDRDYAEMKSQIYQEMGLGFFGSGFRMAGDSEKLKFLDAEQQRDVLALMTPEEREMNDLRNSPSAQRVQGMYASKINLSEDEYKAIYALQKTFDDTYDMERQQNSGGDISPEARSEMYKARTEAAKEMEAQIKDMVGPERWAEYSLRQRYDYNMLQAAAQRFNLSADTVARTYQAREDAASEARRISDDSSMSASQKTEAYTALSERATSQIRASLGDEVGDEYIKQALSWLKNLPAGRQVTVDDRGNVSVR